MVRSWSVGGSPSGEALPFRDWPPDDRFGSPLLPLTAFSHLGVSADGIAVAFLSGGTRVVVADAGSGALRAAFDEPHRPSALALSRDGGKVLLGFAFNRFRTAEAIGPPYDAALWDVVTRREVGRWDFGLGIVDGVALSPDGLMAAAASGKKVVVWDLDV